MAFIQSLLEQKGPLEGRSWSHCAPQQEIMDTIQSRITVFGFSAPLSIGQSRKRARSSSWKRFLIEFHLNSNNCAMMTATPNTTYTRHLSFQTREKPKLQSSGYPGTRFMRIHSNFSSLLAEESLADVFDPRSVTVATSLKVLKWGSTGNETRTKNDPLEHSMAHSLLNAPLC